MSKFGFKDGTNKMIDEKKMEQHWTERSIEDYMFRIKADAIAQMEDLLNRHDLEEISHYFSINDVIKFAKENGLKTSLVVYNDKDKNPENKKGPINSEIFIKCWEKCGKPHDFWELEEKKK